jgi:hypothetical protein
MWRSRNDSRCRSSPPRQISTESTVPKYSLHGNTLNSADFLKAQYVPPISVFPAPQMNEAALDRLRIYQAMDFADPLSEWLSDWGDVSMNGSMEMTGRGTSRTSRTSTVWYWSRWSCELMGGFDRTQVRTMPSNLFKFFR